MGTPAYMSPEQAAGDLDRLGPRSDVYSLGATLYCLLTGKPPFEGDDLGAVLRAVGKGDFPPPRQLDPAIDRALEAVCLKAMALKPEDRYATSRALADDVERWAADEPVTAWREPFGRRARRWARRNRTAVTAAAAALLMAMVGLTAVLAVQTRANAALKVANTRLEISNQREVKANADLNAANERERARFALAQEAIRTFYTGVSEDLLLKQKEFDTLRTKLLRGAREFYQRLEGLLEGHKDRESRLALGRAYRDVGELTILIGSREEALAVHQRALGLFEEVSREAPDDPEPRYEVGKSSVVIGSLLSSIRSTRRGTGGRRTCSNDPPIAGRSWLGRRQNPKRARQRRALLWIDRGRNGSLSRATGSLRTGAGHSGGAGRGESLGRALPNGARIDLR